MFYEEVEAKTRKYLIDLRDPKKLSIIQRRNPELVLEVMSPYKFKKNIKALQGLK
jgi:hypothetical protein